MLNPKWKDWRAYWIAHPSSHEFAPPQPYLEEGERNAYYFFRREFTIDNLPRKALLSITGSSYYRLWINGNMVDRGPVTSMVFYRYYNELDVTGFLHQGNNTIAVELQINGKTFQAGLLAELADENNSVLAATDESWRCCIAEAWQTNTFYYCASVYTPYQESFDARKEPKGWKLNNFDASRWENARIWRGNRGDDTPPAVTPWFNLIKRDIPLLQFRDVRPEKILSLSENIHVQCSSRDREDLSLPLSAEGQALKHCRIINAEAFLSANGSCELSGFGKAAGGEVYDPAILLDFGKILRGRPVFEAEGPAGSRISFGYAEDLIDGHFNIAVTTPFADSFRLSGEKTVFMPFMWKSFRYLKIRVWGSPPYTVRILRFHVEQEIYPFNHRAVFQTPDKEIQQVYDMSVNTVDLCTSDCIFDTPSRETGQWCYDICGSILHTLLWSMGETRMTRKYLDQTSHSMRPTGIPAPISNYSGIFWRTYNDVGLHYPRAMWEYYLYSGDDSLLMTEYPKLLTTLDFYRNFRNGDGFLAHLPDSFIDWSYNLNEDARRGVSAALNAHYAWMLLYLEKIALHYKDHYRAAQCREDYAILKEKYSKMFLTETGDGLIDSIFHGVRSKSVSEYACALAIHAGLLTETVQNRLVDAVFDRCTVKALEGDCFATHTILTALDKAGRFDLVLRIIRERWGKRWASLGYTSTPEHWARFYCDGDRNNFPSHSHGWSGGPAELLTHQLLGIEIVVPGFKTIRINPKSPGFDVNVELSTPSGIIRGECRKNQWKLSLPDKIKILPNRSVYCPH